MIGIVMAGGKGTRLYPFTEKFPKSLLEVHDKPAILFPINTLMAAGIRTIVINIADIQACKNIIAAEKIDAKITYVAEKNPQGIVSALLEMEKIIKNQPTLVILGDIYLTFDIKLPKFWDECCIYLTSRFDRDRINEYGVAQLGDNEQFISFEEKPLRPKGKLVHMGVTFFPSDLIQVLKEFGGKYGNDLTAVANCYLENGRITSNVYNETWFNMGTFYDLFSAGAHRWKIVERLPIL